MLCMVSEKSAMILLILLHVMFLFSHCLQEFFCHCFSAIDSDVARVFLALFMIVFVRKQLFCLRFFGLLGSVTCFLS